jgi:hypothetical protein
LGLVDDLDKRKEKFIQSNKNIEKYFNQVLKLKSQFKTEFKGLSKEYEKLGNEYDDLFKKANEIGADKLATEAFKSKAELANVYGQGWDNDLLRFFQK